MTGRLPSIVTSEIKRDTLSKYSKEILSDCVSCNVGRVMNKTWPGQRMYPAGSRATDCFLLIFSFVDDYSILGKKLVSASVELPAAMTWLVIVSFSISSIILG
jgi:hypothetical protein